MSPRDIRVNSSVSVPEDAITVKAVRSSGPGGQNVNKVSSKVELWVDVSQIVGLNIDGHARLRALAGSRLGADGNLLFKSDLTRDQARNLADALEKARLLILQATIVPKKRRPTKPTRGSVTRRLEGKTKRATVKKTRSGRWDD